MKWHCMHIIDLPTYPPFTEKYQYMIRKSYVTYQLEIALTSSILLDEWISGKQHLI